MQRDIRSTGLYRAAQQFCSEVRQPGKGQISDALQVHASPDGRHVVFAATIADRVEQEPPTRIASTELATGTTRILTSGPGTDRLPRFSPDGRTVAFVSDRGNERGSQVFFYDREGAVVKEVVAVEGSIEQLQWSPDGTRILLNVVAADTNVPGTESWLPWIDSDWEDRHRRSCWIYELASDALRPVAANDCNTWEASWCGRDTLAVVASAGSGEGHWYSASLRVLDARTGKYQTLYRPADQLGTPIVSPAGKRIAMVEGLCSDRGPVVGDLRFVDLSSGTCRKVDTHGVDISYVQWYSDQHLLLMGSRGLQTVVGVYDAVSDGFGEIWSSYDLAVTRLGVCALGVPGDCVLVTESFTQAPELTVVRGGRALRVASFDVGYAEATRVLESVERLSWSAPDGLQIEGYLLRPRARPPFPLILDVHGGPVGHWKPAYLIRRMVHVPLLLSHGFAVFLPNPRGSSGRGQEFARRVMGDLGGADALDLLSGLDALIERGLGDPGRIGVNGTSYGGFMAAWLITQCARFAAAVAVSPHTNQLTATLLSNIPQFMSRLVADELGNPQGRYFARSPVLHASRATTPILNICGARDLCTPAEEALQFHTALRQYGTESVLLTYPQEGHGIRRLPAMLDCATRIAAWFIDHIPEGSIHDD